MGCFQGIEQLIKEAEIAIARHDSIENLEVRIYDAINRCGELGDVNRDGLASVISQYFRKLHGEAQPSILSLDNLVKATPPKPKPIEWQP